MTKYIVKQYTEAEWNAKTEAEYESGEFINEEDVITIVWKKKAVCMDIMANGKRIVPILRKIEKAMTDAGLAGENSIYAGWFGEWANNLTDKIDKKYFIWKYDGRTDAERGIWSYSWEIEQIDEDRWYIFLNLALPEEEPTNTEDTDTEKEEEETMKRTEAIKQEIENTKVRSAWSKGVKTYAYELAEQLEEGIHGGWYYEDDLDAPKVLEKMLLNGAQDWKQYSWGGSALIYDGDIAERLCNPSELTKTRHGQRRPNKSEEWLDIQARALYQASRLVREAVERTRETA